MAASSRRQPPGEFELLAKVRAAVERDGRGRGVLVGIGDDAAVVQPSAAAHRGRVSSGRGPASSGSASFGACAPLVLTTDTMVEGVHFHSDWLTPRQLGIRAFRAAVSDVSAMGARPRWVLLSLEIAGRAGAAGDALALVRGLSADARRSGAALVGGNVSGAERTAVTVTVIGEAAGKPLLRSNAKPGHLVFVTGALGGAAAGCRALLARGANGTVGARTGAAAGAAARAETAAIAAYRLPPLRIGFASALAGRGLAAAMIDISDGLLQDLAHVADESGVTIRVDAAAVPVHRGARPQSGRGASKSARNAASADGDESAMHLALTGGEDYELAFTAPKSRRAAIEALAARHRTPVSVIGRVEHGRPQVTDADGRPFAVPVGGFDHLRRPERSARKAG